MAERFLGRRSKKEQRHGKDILNATESCTDSLGLRLEIF